MVTTAMIVLSLLSQYRGPARTDTEVKGLVGPKVSVIYSRGEHIGKSPENPAGRPNVRSQILVPRRRTPGSCLPGPLPRVPELLDRAALTDLDPGLSPTIFGTAFSTA